MAKLLGTERIGDRLNRDWLHTGPDGRSQITVETVQDVEPVITAVKRRRDDPRPGPVPDGKWVASIPGVVVMEAAKVNARTWGISTAEAYREIALSKTDRAKRVWRLLTAGRDFRKFQAKG